MTVKQPLAQLEENNNSEASILLFSFVIAFVAGILMVSTLFFTVKKLESKHLLSDNITYSNR
ncbi:hypothetical protein SAE01_14030 [Segetibacter aerophilus]|uniref:Uncharacterized protein n=1 Tax=Segetibacter aerophilus TaxID=670293 RepID=A0A512BAP7_9BACT|nr:hypothetical protein SAE01_14030 [Segetibacter aerophilus]